MKFTATDTQMCQLIANAVNASTPMGMGFIHYRPRDFAPENFLPALVRGGDIDLDYVEGRMVKIWIHRLGDGEWEIDDATPRRDYQSWCGKYSSYATLVASAGISIDSKASQR